MSQRWVEKEEAEKQLYEILQLIQQVHEKMEKVVEDAIEECYEQNKMQLERVERQFDHVEQQLRDVAEESEPPLSLASKLFFV